MIVNSQQQRNKMQNTRTTHARTPHQQLRKRQSPQSPIPCPPCVSICTQMFIDRKQELLNHKRLHGIGRARPIYAILKVRQKAYLCCACCGGGLFWLLQGWQRCRGCAHLTCCWWCWCWCWCLSRFAPTERLRVRLCGGTPSITGRLFIACYFKAHCAEVRMQGLELSRRGGEGTCVSMSVSVSVSVCVSVCLFLHATHTHTQAQLQKDTVARAALMQYWYFLSCSLGEIHRRVELIPGEKPRMFSQIKSWIDNVRCCCCCCCCCCFVFVTVGVSVSAYEAFEAAHRAASFSPLILSLALGTHARTRMHRCLSSMRRKRRRGY